MSLTIGCPLWSGDNIKITAFNTWFAENVEPLNAMLREGVDVEGRDLHNEYSMWTDRNSLVDTTHKALLINISKIKEQSREEKLAEFLEYWIARRDWKLPDPFINEAKKLIGDK